MKQRLRDADGNTGSPLNLRAEASNDTGWVPYLTTLGTAALGGLTMSGPIGALTGLGVSIVDEYLIAHGHTSKHYLSLSSFWSAMLGNTGALLPVNQALIQTAALAAAPVITHLTGDFLDFRQKLAGPIDSLLTLNRLFDSKDILSTQELGRIYDVAWESPSHALSMVQEDAAALADNPFLSNLLSSVLCGLASVGVDQASLHLLAGYGKRGFVKMQLHNSKESSSAQEIMLQGLKMVGLMAGKEVVKFAISQVKKTVQASQSTLLSHKSAELLLAGSNGQKIALAENGREIQQNLVGDISLLASEGTEALQKSLSDLVGAFASFYPLNQLAPDALAVYLPTLILSQVWQGPLADAYKNLEKSLGKTKAAIQDMATDMAHNIEAIKLRDAEAYSQSIYAELLSKKGDIEVNLADLNAQKTTSVEGLLTLGFALDTFYYAYKYMAGSLGVSELISVNGHVDNIYDFFNSPMTLKLNSAGLSAAKDRIESLVDILNAPESPHAAHTTNDMAHIIFDDYALKLDDHTIVAIPHLELELGQHYLVTGPSGTGKTSTLIDLKQGVVGALSSFGTISLPIIAGQEAKVTFIDQKLYLPYKATLLETLYFPNVLTAENKVGVREQVIKLMQELDMDEFVHNLDAPEGLLSRLDSNSFKLSGGQIKKAGFIQAAFAEPDILILDESFTGLDHMSLAKAQAFLNAHLPKTTILSVDHEGKHHNEGHFYHQELHFEGGKVTLESLLPKAENAIMPMLRLLPMDHEHSILPSEAPYVPTNGSVLKMNPNAIATVLRDEGCDEMLYDMAIITAEPFMEGFA